MQTSQQTPLHTINDTAMAQSPLIIKYDNRIQLHCRQLMDSKGELTATDVVGGKEITAPHINLVESMWGTLGGMSVRSAS